MTVLKFTHSYNLTVQHQINMICQDTNYRAKHESVGFSCPNFIFINKMASNPISKSIPVTQFFFWFILSFDLKKISHNFAEPVNF